MTATSEVGEAGEAGEAVSSGDVKPKDKDKKVDASPQEQSTATASAQGIVNSGKDRSCTIMAFKNSVVRVELFHRDN